MGDAMDSSDDRARRPGRSGQPGTGALLGGSAVLGLAIGLSLAVTRSPAPPPPSPRVERFVVIPLGEGLRVEVAAPPALALDVVVRQGSEEVARARTAPTANRVVDLEDLPRGEELAVLLERRREGNSLLVGAERLTLPRVIEVEALRTEHDPNGYGSILRGRIRPPRPLEAFLEDPGAPAPVVTSVHLLENDGGASADLAVRLPLLPPGSESALELRAAGALLQPSRIPLGAPALPTVERSPPDPELRSFAADPGGVALLTGPRTLRFRPLRGPDWTYSHPDALSGPPRLLDGLVVVRAGAREVLALDRSTGALRWRREAPGPLLATPRTMPGHRLLVATRGEGAPPRLMALDAREGLPLWKSWVSVPGPSLAGRPHGTVRAVLAVTRDGRVVRSSPTEGRPLWALPLPDLGEVTCEAALDPEGQRLALGGRDGVVRTVDLEARDTRSAPTPAPLPREFARATVLGPVRHVLFGPEGDLRVLGDREAARLSPTGDVVWRAPLPGPPSRGLAHFQGRLLLGLSSGGLAVLRDQDGALLEVRPGGGLMAGSLEDAEAGVYWATPEEGVVLHGGGGRPSLAGGPGPALPP